MDSVTLGEKFGSTLHAGDVVAYFGPMGAGKTTFTRGICKALNVDESEVCSPTFAIVNSYNGIFPVYHFDMYRILDLDSLYSTGFFDYIGSNAVLLIEWSENIESFLPEDCIRVNFSYGDNVNERLIEIIGGCYNEDSCN